MGQHAPQARVPSAQVAGASPPRHRTLHCETSVHTTWQVPVHSASQVDTLVHRIVLAGPASAPHVETFAHA
jgi:hypothetical protein